MSALQSIGLNSHQRLAAVTITLVTLTVSPSLLVPHYTWRNPALLRVPVGLQPSVPLLPQRPGLGAALDLSLQTSCQTSTSQPTGPHHSPAVSAVWRSLTEVGPPAPTPRAEAWTAMPSPNPYPCSRPSHLAPVCLVQGPNMRTHL